MTMMKMLIIAMMKTEMVGHSKITRVSVTRKRVHWGHTPFRVNSDPECGQLSADLTNKGVRLTQLWVIFRVKLTDLNARKYDHVSPLLKQLHWLPVSKRIMYKVASIVYKSIHSLTPQYISCLFSPVHYNQDIHYAQGLTLIF